MRRGQLFSCSPVHQSKVLIASFISDPKNQESFVSQNIFKFQGTVPVPVVVVLCASVQYSRTMQYVKIVRKMHCAKPSASDGDLVAEALFINKNMHGCESMGWR